MIDVALFEAVFNMMEGTLPEYDMLGEIRERTGTGLSGIVPSNTYPTADAPACGDWRECGQHIQRLMTLIGRQDLADDPSLADNAGRCKRANELDAAIGEWTARHDVDEAVAKLNSAQVPNGKDLQHRRYRARSAVPCPRHDSRGDFAGGKTFCSSPGVFYPPGPPGPGVWGGAGPGNPSTRPPSFGFHHKQKIFP